MAMIVLLFEPRRLAEIDPYVDPKSPELMAAIPNLLTVIRNLAPRSEGIKQLVSDSASPAGLILNCFCQAYRGCSSTVTVRLCSILKPRRYSSISQVCHFPFYD